MTSIYQGRNKGGWSLEELLVDRLYEQFMHTCLGSVSVGRVKLLETVLWQLTLTYGYTE